MAWFSDWFNSPYYHILYGNHNREEAEAFITNLWHWLHIQPGDTVLDLACGRGRHSVFLSKLGARTTGIDLSPNNIAAASPNECERLHFAVHDMRQVYKPEAFQFVLNLFTSFGYFSPDYENQQVIEAAAADLQPGGLLLIDFMNTPLVLNNLSAGDSKEAGGILFRITRRLEADTLIKTISFTAEGRDYCFEERVKALTLPDFERYFNAAGLHLTALAGNYNLSPYLPETSPRLIMQARKG